MPLIEEFEKSGNWLFKYRGQLPMLLYPAMIVMLYLYPQEWISFNNIKWSMACFTVSLLGMLVRAYTIGHTPKNTSGRNTEEQIADVLNTQGIYATVRHPLYLGNYLMWLGLLLYIGNLGFLLIVSLLYWIYYERIMFAEEAFLRNKFGNAYIAWAKTTPAFIPKLSQWKSGDLTFSLKNVLKREYTGLLVLVISFALINVLKHYFYLGQWGISGFWLTVLILGVVVALSLRTLKKRTAILEVAGR